jgi:hypothetical protein
MPLELHQSNWQPLQMSKADMKSFETLGKLAAHFKDLNKPGEQAILTTKQDKTRVNTNIRLRGVVVKLTGSPGDYLATFVRLDKKIGDYGKSKRGDVETHLFNKKKHLLEEDGEAVYMESNVRTLEERLRENGYAGRYTLNASGKGWMVSIRSKK